MVFIHAAIFDERLKKESFDVILAFNVLHLLKNYQQAMQRITELLKPKGLFISITPCLAEEMDFRNRLEFYFLLTLMKLRIIQPLKRFKIFEIEDLIAKNLQIVEIEKFYHVMTSYFIVAKKF